MRLDRALVERGLVDSREKARERIGAGEVFVDGRVVLKPAASVTSASVLSLVGRGCPYVSRGGLKLEKALDVFGVQPAGKVILDAGASRGGFTDCLLQRGARLVYALDVGRGQLAEKLQEDPRVRSLEGRNLRNARPEWFDPSPEMATVDVSFISLRRVLPVLAQLLPEGGDTIGLVKPQFEAGRRVVPRSGVVTSPATQCRVLLDILRAGEEEGLTPWGVTFSPLRGEKGNLEFFLWFRKGVVSPSKRWEDECIRTVEEAHRTLGNRSFPHVS